MDTQANSSTPTPSKTLARSRSRYKRQRPAIIDGFRQLGAAALKEDLVPDEKLHSSLQRSHKQVSYIQNADSEATSPQDHPYTLKSSLNRRNRPPGEDTQGHYMGIESAQDIRSVGAGMRRANGGKPTNRFNLQGDVERHARQRNSDRPEMSRKGRARPAAAQFSSIGDSERSDAYTLDGLGKSLEATTDCPIRRERSNVARPRQEETGFTSQSRHLVSCNKPAFDAPISAVNAGERRVTVEHQRSVVSVSVMPSTISVDVVRAASMQLGVALDIGTTVVLESFRQLGLERPLRRYERVREVLNSWDYDAQNALVIVSSPAGSSNGILDPEDVRKHVGDICLQLYHSQRPGYWKKETMNLGEDGQISIKAKGAATNLCHLSDFDIYVPTKRQLSKKIKPPKKVCFAIKSQQKSSMFLSTENYVHLFTTNDKELAAKWYAAVQGWRSWYLVHVLGEGLHKTPPEAETSPANTTMHDPGPGIKDPGPSCQSNAKTDHQGKRLGVSSTLRSRTNFSGAENTPSSSRRVVSKGVGKHSHPRVSEPIAEPVGSEPYASTGLLGRTYTLRKKALEERNAIVTPDGTSAEIRRVKTNPLLDESKQSKPMPLVDLTPQYNEPPQFRRGKGVTPDHMPAGGLVEVATSPENAIQVPPATAWGRSGEPHMGSQRSGTIRSRYAKGTTSKQTGRWRSSPEKVFSPKGLLSTQRYGEGGLGYSRGIPSGDRNAKSSMMDLCEGSRYAPGSLLASVERSGGGDGRPDIERGKK